MSKDSEKPKILIIGDGGVGKSTYVRQINTGKFKSKYDTTIGMEPHSLTLLTTGGEKDIVILDTAGQEKFGNLRQEIYNYPTTLNLCYRNTRVKILHHILIRNHQ